MKIRVMKKRDWKKCLELWKNIPGMGLNNIDDTEEGIVRFLCRNPKTCFVAEADGIFAGTLIAGHDGRRGYIYHTAVLPQFRRRGIATALLQAATDALKKQGIAKVALLVFSDNESGNAFWEKHGFAKRTDITYRNKVISDEDMVRNREEK
ncbi:GNAT family N-acetyltransferase [uncultured Treponema sp.]|uniref:GNAT family N-acetyltransferase n=1 Tax=uncultured Treponema sp. TaxID=162155 RepID=UPI00280AEBC9|nr:GNAT family N-acetyltransferase [uncultured Treponema sp.]